MIASRCCDIAKSSRVGPAHKGGVMKKKYQWINKQMLRIFCQHFATEKAHDCPYFFPYKDISKINTPEYGHGIWAYRKGLEGKDCIVADECWDGVEE